MESTNLLRLDEYFEARGIDVALLSSPWTVAWLTGYAPPIQAGPSPFDGGPALACWRRGEVILIASDGEGGSARSLGIDVREYAGYTLDEPLTVVERQAAALREVMTGWRDRGSMAVEMRFLPAPLFRVLQETLPGVRLEPLNDELGMLRAVKTPDEIAKLRASLALCDLAQAEVAARLRTGVTEIELWGQVKTALEVAAGGRLPVLTDFVAGTRTGEVGGLPGPYMLQEGDPVMADIVPRRDGYWGDICGIHFAGAPSAEMAKVYGIVLDTLRRGIAAVRPGLQACELDELLRGTVEAAGYPAYPHHSGHGIGVSYHEEPRIVPYNRTRLETGMVIALEPGIYLPGVGGVRLENVVLVTEDGCEVLTKHLGN